MTQHHDPRYPQRGFRRQCGPFHYEWRPMPPGVTIDEAERLLRGYLLAETPPFCLLAIHVGCSLELNFDDGRWASAIVVHVDEPIEWPTMLQAEMAEAQNRRMDRRFARFQNTLHGLRSEILTAVRRMGGAFMSPEQINNLLDRLQDGDLDEGLLDMIEASAAVQECPDADEFAEVPPARAG